MAPIHSLRPSFGDALHLKASEVKASEVYFRRVAETLESLHLAGAAGAAENLADVLNANGNVLYSDVAVCTHLASVLRAVLADGARVQYCGQPWAAKCNIWVYFNIVLDCENLKAVDNLAPCIEIHDHSGTHDGTERGLAWNEHHGALMGVHPEYAGST